MRSPAARLTVILALAAAGLLALAVGRELVDPALVNLSLYLLASTVLLTDGIDVVIRLLARRGPAALPPRDDGIKRLADRAAGEVIQPYALIMSVHNLSRDASETLHHLAAFKSSTWIVDDCSSDATVLLLEQAGWRCLPAPRNMKKPAALKLLLGRLPREIRTVLVLDPDIRVLDSGRFEVSDLERAIRSFQRSGAAAWCPRIRVRPDGLLANLQVLEFSFAFELGRRSLGRLGITSGVALYDRDKLERTLRRHSLAVYAEDLENALLLLSAGEEVYYDGELVVQTEGQRRLRGWFSQRVGWSFGLMKVYVERRREIACIMRRSAMAFYQYAVYLGALSILLYPLKLASLLLLTVSAANALDNLLGSALIADTVLTAPVYFAAVYVKYTLLAGICVGLTRPRLTPDRCLLTIPVYFFYALGHLIPAGVGYLNWVALRFAGRRIFNDHYDAAPVLRRGGPLGGPS